MAINLIKILRDMAAGRRNEVGDHWSKDWCGDAADYIEDMKDPNLQYVCYRETEILYIGNMDECEEFKAAEAKKLEKTQPLYTWNWQITSLAEYGEACYQQGYESAEVLTEDY